MNQPESQPQAESASPWWRWWRELQEHDRAGRAELRRCGSTAEVAFTAPFHRLLQRLGSRLNETDSRRVALIAAVLAHVESEPSGPPVSLAEQMGRPANAGGGPAVSDTRFRHLLSANDDDAMLRELVRVVRQLGRIARVESLARDLMDWSDRVRMRWARDYYAQSVGPNAEART